MRRRWWLAAAVGVGLVTVAAVGMGGRQSFSACVEEEQRALMTRWLSPLGAQDALVAARQACAPALARERAAALERCEAIRAAHGQEPDWVAHEAAEAAWQAQWEGRPTGEFQAAVLRRAFDRDTWGPRAWQRYRDCRVEAWTR